MLIDRTDPDAPALAGGSSLWQDVASVDVTATPGGDLGGSGYDSTSYRTSTDGGATWSARDHRHAGVGQRRGRPRWCGSAAIDVAGNASAWADATRPHRSHRSDRSGRLRRLQRRGRTSPRCTWPRPARPIRRGSASPSYERQISTDGGAELVGRRCSRPPRTVTDEGETLVQLPRRRRRRAAPATGWSGTARIDRTAPTDPSLAGGRLAGSAQHSALVTAAARPSRSGGFGRLRVRDLVGRRLDLVGPHRRPIRRHHGRGQDGGAVPRVDGAGQPSAWVQTTVKLDRTAPTAPTLSGGSSGVAERWPRAAVAPPARPMPAPASFRLPVRHVHRRRGDLVGPAVRQLYRGLGRGPDAGAVPRASTTRATRSAWVQAHRRSSTARAPTAPTVSGGSTAWQSVASADRHRVGLDRRRLRPRPGTSTGRPPTAARPGRRRPRRRPCGRPPRARHWCSSAAIDGVGLRSNWVQATRQQRRSTAPLPTAPTVTGGSTVLAERGLGHDHRERQHRHRRLRPGRLPVPRRRPTAAPPGRPRRPAPRPRSPAEGQTIVQFRSMDGAGNVSAWAPATAGARAPSSIDRTAPTAPTVDRRLASLAEHRLGHGHRVRRRPTPAAPASTSTSTGPRPTAAPPGRPPTAALGRDHAAGRDPGAVPRRRRRRQRLGWTQAPAPCGSTAPPRRRRPVARRLPVLAATAPGTVSATGGTDAMSGLAGYQYRTSTTAAPAGRRRPPAQRHRRGRGQDARPVPLGGRRRQRLGLDAGSSGAANTVKLDRTARRRPR